MAFSMLDEYSLSIGEEILEANLEYSRSQWESGEHSTSLNSSRLRAASDSFSFSQASSASISAASLNKSVRSSSHAMAL
jgi:hypothetical protein